MRCLLLAFCISIACISASRFGRHLEGSVATPMARQSDSDGQVRSIVEERFRAANAKTVSDIAPIYSHDEKLIIFRQGEIFRGWDAYENYWKAALAGLPPGFELKFDDVRIQTTPRMAFATALWTTTYPDKSSQQISTKGLITLVLIYNPSGWHIVHEHISANSPADK